MKTRKPRAPTLWLHPRVALKLPSLRHRSAPPAKLRRPRDSRQRAGTGAGDRHRGSTQTNHHRQNHAGFSRWVTGSSTTPPKGPPSKNGPRPSASCTNSGGTLSSRRLQRDEGLFYTFFQTVKTQKIIWKKLYLC